MIPRLLFFCLIILLSVSCDSTKKSTPSGTLQPDRSPIAETNKCKIPGTVKDYTGTDGCKFLIEVANGEKWLPSKINDKSFQLSDGQKIVFGYKEVKDGISVCMAESKIIEVTCIKEASAELAKPMLKDCANLKQPMEIKWMADIVSKENPTRITKFDFQDGFAYMIFTKNKRFLYDCQGKKLCPTSGSDTRACLTQYLSQLSNNIEIYVEGPDGE